jgi:hypothetical protein
LAVKTVCCTCVVGGGFRLLGVSRTQALLRNWSAKGLAVPMCPSAVAAYRVATWRIHGLWKRYLNGEGRCLIESMALWALLRREGLDCRLRVGFRKTSDTWAGHAWVEFEQEPWNEVATVAGAYDVREGDFDRKKPRRP